MPCALFVELWELDTFQFMVWCTDSDAVDILFCKVNIRNANHTRATAHIFNYEQQFLNQSNVTKWNIAWLEPTTPGLHFECFNPWAMGVWNCYFGLLALAIYILYIYIITDQILFTNVERFPEWSITWDVSCLAKDSWTNNYNAENALFVYEETPCNEYLLAYSFICQFKHILIFIDNDTISLWYGKYM